jgi:hypothetical protein
MRLDAADALFPCITLAIVSPRRFIVIPLILICIAIVVAMAVAASRGKLHMAGYIGIAIAAFAAAMVLGKISGLRGVSGTVVGLVLSVLFFFAISAVLGSIAALMFYKAQPESEETK